MLVSTDVLFSSSHSPFECTIPSDGAGLRPALFIYSSDKAVQKTSAVPNTPATNLATHKQRAINSAGVIALGERHFLLGELIPVVQTVHYAQGACAIFQKTNDKRTVPLKARVSLLTRLVRITLILYNNRAYGEASSESCVFMRV